MRQAHGAFETHIRDAIALNWRRMSYYARLSGGRSLPVSVTLIAAEVIVLPVARWFDRRARRWTTAGVPLLDEVFAPMSEAPAHDAVASSAAGIRHLSRHLIESAARVAWCTPPLCERAAAAGLPSPRPLLESLLRLHLRGLAVARLIDQIAHSAQKRGAPILANDLPPTPRSFGAEDSDAPSRDRREAFEPIIQRAAATSPRRLS